MTVDQIITVIAGFLSMCGVCIAGWSLKRNVAQGETIAALNEKTKNLTSDRISILEQKAEDHSSSLNEVKGDVADVKEKVSRIYNKFINGKS